MVKVGSRVALLGRNVRRNALFDRASILFYEIMLEDAQTDWIPQDGDEDASRLSCAVAKDWQHALHMAATVYRGDHHRWMIKASN
jgi:hypothetical protein